MIRKDAANSGVESIHEMLFYLRKNYSPRTEERAHIEDIPQDDRFSFKEMSDYLKTFSKTFSCYRSQKYGFEKQGVTWWLDININQFEDWMFRVCGIKKQTIYNYKNLYKLMIIAPKLLNCRVNDLFC